MKARASIRPALRLGAALSLTPLIAPPALADEEPAPSVSVKLLAAAPAAQAVAAALEECSRRGFQTAVSLVGRDGHLLAFSRDPLASPLTIEVSRGKAFAAAAMRTSTAEIAATDAAAGLRFAAGMMVLQGGLPIEAGGVFYGGIGVSGATAEADEECARAGIGAISDTLEFAE